MLVHMSRILAHSTKNTAPYRSSAGLGVTAIEGSITVDLNDGAVDTLNILADTTQTSSLVTTNVSYASEGGPGQVYTVVTSGSITGLGSNFTLTYGRLTLNIVCY